ncbi:MAG TPA: ABC transporter ATP-binding protein [Candidatus Sabulitectum sp.]|nr:ABC transporter ATP-binding protein [Candidatus Sabulitectum sp.]HPR21373.1 ABC transporter ATP-binding protein [Candidatus Sabulitectum sp.]
MLNFYDDFSDDRAVKVSSLKLLTRFIPYVKPHWKAFLAAVLLLLLAIAGELAGPLVLRAVIDDAIPSGSSSEIIRLSGLFAVIFLVTMAIAYLQVIIASRIGLGIVRSLKRQLFDHVLTLSMAFFHANPSGKLMARVESDTERVRMLFSETSMALLRNAAMVVGTMVIMFQANGYIALRVLAITVPVALISIPVLKRMRVIWGKVRMSYASIAAIASEFVRAVPVLQVFGTTGFAREKMHREGKEYFRREMKASLLEYGFWSFLGTLEIGAVAVILVAGRPGVISGAVTVGTVVLFVEYTRRLFGPLVMFGETLNQIQRALASGERLMEILDTKTLTPDGSITGGFPSDWGKIEFRDVWFRYSEESDWALKGVSFVISRGDTIALVGDSGGGKSTIVSLLMRFHYPQKGSITIDGVNINDYTLDSWRSGLGLVLQEVNLFSGSLSGNLTLFDHTVSREAQENALRAIEAGELLDSIPDGLDGRISEGGANLSMGQRQLINIARAMLRQPEILVLDEATSSVDPGTEKRIQRATDIALEGRTALVVAHRLATIEHATRIIVVRHGRVVEMGTHRELLAEGGIYAGLHGLQFGEGGAV